MLDALLAEIDDVSAAPARADRQGRRASARKRMADGDQAAHGDPRRRLRVRPARLPLLAAPGRRQRASTTCRAGSRRSCRSTTAWRSSCGCCARTARPAGTRRTRGVFQLMLTTAKVAQLLRLTLPARPAVRAGDQRQQVRAQHPLHRRRRHGPRHGLRRRRRVRADVLQSLTGIALLTGDRYRLS